MILISLEQEVDNYLRSCGALFRNNADTDNIDFTISVNEKDISRNYWLEVKEKRQQTNTSAWPNVNWSAHNIFIIDELAIRRLLTKAPNAGVLVRDAVKNRYYFSDITRLVLMPRMRVNRDVSNTCRKGKWMLNLKDFSRLDLNDLYSVLESHLNYLKPIYDQTTECFGNFESETIPTGGEPRSEAMRRYDYNATR